RPAAPPPPRPAPPKTAPPPPKAPPKPVPAPVQDLDFGEDEAEEAALPEAEGALILDPIEDAAAVEIDDIQVEPDEAAEVIPLEDDAATPAADGSGDAAFDDLF